MHTVMKTTHDYSPKCMSWGRGLQCHVVPVSSFREHGVSPPFLDSVLSNPVIEWKLQTIRTTAR